MRLEVVAACLHPLDVIGSGEEVVRVSAGIRTPSGKVEVVLFNPRNGRTRVCTWGSRTIIGVQRYA